MAAPLRTQSRRAPTHLPVPFVAGDRQAVERFLEQFLDAKEHGDANGDVARGYARYVCRGKMMRAMLVILAYRIGRAGPLPEEVLRCAAALELLHSAMLIHDDLIDRSEARRGLPAWHVRYARVAARRDPRRAAHVGRSMALCAGDVGFFFAFEMLAQLGVDAATKQRLLTVITRTVGAAGLGEMHEIRLALDHRCDDSAIFEVYAQKTAGYSCALPLTVGGLLSGLDADTVTELGAIGHCTGQMFQIIDDELDLFGDAQELGKPIGNDAREGRHTLFYALLSRRLRPAEWAAIAPLFGNRALRFDDLLRVRAAVDRAGIRELVGTHLERTAAEARRRAAALTVEPAHRAALLDMIGAVLARRP